MFVQSRFNGKNRLFSIANSLKIDQPYPMSDESKPKVAMTDRIYNAVGAVIPNCEPALRMVELGQKRPLNLKEKFVLLYNTPLCPHCNCNREKFKEGKAKMAEAASRRA